VDALTDWFEEADAEFTDQQNEEGNN
jgi:hypothetical protein